MSNKRKTKMGAADLQRLQDDWDRAAFLERLAIGELTDQQQERIDSLPDATLTLSGTYRDDHAPGRPDDAA